MQTKKYVLLTNSDRLIPPQVIGFLYVAFLLSAKVYAQTPLALRDGLTQHIFSYDAITYFVDSANTTGEKVLSGQLDALFKPARAFAPANESIHARYWLKVSIKHNGRVANNYFLEFFDQTIDSIAAFLPDTAGGYQQLFLGDQHQFTARQIKHKNFVMPIENLPQGTYSYYFCVKAGHPINMILVLRSAAFFTYYALNEYFYFGLFYGLVLLISLYNLLLYFAIRERPYLLFVLYALLIAFYFGSSDGFAYQYLWPSLPNWNAVAPSVLSCLLVLFGLLFAQAFLHLRAKSPKLSRLVVVAIAFRIVFFLLEVAGVPGLNRLGLLGFAPLCVLLYIAIRLYTVGYQPARLLMLAYGALCLGFVVRGILNLGIIHDGAPVLLYYVMHIAFFAQLVALSLALGDKVRILKFKKDRAMRRIVAQHEINARLQTKVNRELELKVKERTLEIKAKNEALEQANDQLEKQAEEINKMNLSLDRDNWKLKRQSRENVRKNLLSRGVPYEVFKETFPDKQSCAQYLANMKWQHGFACKKCQYEKYQETTLFARRCSRCGYVESATTGTVFHNIKFPIDKAFYIAHIVIANFKISNGQLSKTLGLREATCANFKRKVKQNMQSKAVTNPSDKGNYLLSE